MTETIPGVAYVRMSSDKQEASPKQQREAIEQMASGKYRVVRWYQDEGISGAESDKREGFQRLIVDATMRKDFQAILCWDQDRFSRFDPIEANYDWHILSKAGLWHSQLRLRVTPGTKMSFRNDGTVPENG